MASVEQYLLTFFVVCVSYVIHYHWKRRALYKISSQLPGPKTVPLIGNAHNLIGNTKQILGYFLYLFDIYGSTFRYWILNRLYVVITEPKDLDIIFNCTTCLEKDHATYKTIIPYVGESLITAPLAKWKKNRKIINPTFSKRVLDSFVPTYTEYFDNLSNKFEKRDGSFDVFGDISRSALEILLDNLMGLKMNVEHNDQYFKGLEEALEIVSLKMYNPWLQFDFIFDNSKYGKKEQEIINLIHGFSKNIITLKKEDLSKKIEDNVYENVDIESRKPFLERILGINEKNEGSVISEQQISEEVTNLMVAGSDSTATTSSFIMTMLGMYPDIQEKVYKEVMDVIGPERSIDAADLPQLQYTDMVMKETLRIFPAVPIIYRKISEELVLDSCVVPAGCAVMIPILLTHRNPKIWPEPMKFNPDRFLPEEIAKRHPQSWVPFSGGSRNCIGFRFAMNEIKVLIANMVRKFKIRTAYKNIEEIEIKLDLFLKTVHGSKIILEPRN